MEAHTAQRSTYFMMQALDRLTTVRPLQTLSFGACSRKTSKNTVTILVPCLPPRIENNSTTRQLFLVSGLEQNSIYVVIRQNAGPDRLLLHPLFQDNPVVVQLLPSTSIDAVDEVLCHELAGVVASDRVRICNRDINLTISSIYYLSLFSRRFNPTS
jgi:hypothetical protein